MHPQLNNTNEDYTKLFDLFGIEDILGEENIVKHVFTTSVYMPMDLSSFVSKCSLYYTGFIKHITLFKHRVEDPDNSLLYIYYDAMIDEFMVPEDYLESQASNNEADKNIKQNYKTNRQKIEFILKLYKIAIENIKADRTKYKHIRLFKYDCEFLKKKQKFLGHPDTFGSIVRFLPMFDNRIEQTTTVNISHAITPRFARLLSIFGQIENKYILSGFTSYLGNLFNYYQKYITILVNNGVFDEVLPHMSILPKNMLYGGCTSIKNKHIKFIGIYNMITKLIDTQNKNPNEKIFTYGIDEIILSLGLYTEQIHCMSLDITILSDNKLEKYEEINKRNYITEILNKIKGTCFFLNDPNYGELYCYASKYQGLNGLYRYWPRIKSDSKQFHEPGFIQCLLRNVEILTKPSDLEVFLGKPDNIIDNIHTSNLLLLLYGYDEYKPIHINISQNDDMPYEFPSIFTIIDIKDKDIFEISSIVFEYMENINLVVPHPYKMSDDFDIHKFINTLEIEYPTTILLKYISLDEMTDTEYIKRCSLFFNPRTMHRIDTKIKSSANRTLKSHSLCRYGSKCYKTKKTINI